MNIYEAAVLDYCSAQPLRKNRVAFNLEPTQINPTTRIAFIAAPDGVTVELVGRSDA